MTSEDPPASAGRLDPLADVVATIAAVRAGIERGEPVDLAPLTDLVGRVIGTGTTVTAPRATQLALLDELEGLVAAATTARDAAETELRRIDQGTRAARAYRGGGGGGGR